MSKQSPKQPKPRRERPTDPKKDSSLKKIGTDPDRPGYNIRKP